MTFMLGSEFLVHTVAMDELSEGCFVHPFVDVDSTFGAFQVTRGFIGVHVLLFGLQVQHL